MQTDGWNGVDLPVYDRHNGTVTKHFVRVLDRVDQLLPRCKPAFTLLFVSLACVWTFSFFSDSFGLYPFVFYGTRFGRLGFLFLTLSSCCLLCSLRLPFSVLSASFFFLMSLSLSVPCNCRKRKALQSDETVTRDSVEFRFSFSWTVPVGSVTLQWLCRGISRLLIEKEKNNCGTISWALLHGNVEFHRYVNVRQCSHLPKLFYE